MRRTTTSRTTTTRYRSSYVQNRIAQNGMMSRNLLWQNQSECASHWSTFSPETARCCTVSVTQCASSVRIQVWYMYAGRDKGKSTQSTDYFSFHVAGMHDTNLFMFLFGIFAISTAFLLVMRRHIKNRFWRTYRPCATDCVLHGCF